MSIHKFPYLLMGFLAAIGISVGSLACGWLCPFGLLQDLLYKLKTVKIRIPEQLCVSRYLILALLVVLLPLVTQETWFCKVCPMGSLQAAIPWAVWNPIIPVYGEQAVSVKALGVLFVVKILIVMVFLGLFIVSKRPFCRLACPLGAIFGFFNKYSIVQLDVNTEKCKDCQKCRDVCPVDINISDNPGNSTCVRCFSCLQCEYVKLKVGSAKRDNGTKTAG